MQTILAVDEAVILFFQNVLRSPVLNPVMAAVSLLGSAGALWFIIAAILLIKKSTRRAGLDMLICMAVCWAASELVIKPLAMRERPFLSVEGLSVLYERFADADSFSFPSSHAASSFAAACALTLSLKKGWIAFIPAALISISRVYIGVHFPSDVVCGALLGALGAAAVFALSRRLVPAPRHSPSPAARRPGKQRRQRRNK